MGEYEPRDSRDVTLSANTAPGEPPRTGPREGAARAEAEKKNEVRDGDQPPASQSQDHGQPSQLSGGTGQSQTRPARSDTSPPTGR